MFGRSSNRPGSHVDRQIAAVQAQPSYNPWAGVSARQIGGIDARGVKYNTIRDVRGEPSFIKNQDAIAAPSFMENPRASDAQLDKMDLKGLTGPRSISFV